MGAKELVAVVGISGVLDKSMNSAVDSAKRKITGISPTALKVAGVVAGIGTAAVGIMGELTGMGTAYQKTMNQLQSKTGASAAEMQGLGNTVKDIYANNFGESIDDVGASVATVKQIMKSTGPELQGVTEGALALRDVFEYDVTESTRAANAMVKNLGVDGETAMSMIAAGAQNGLDFSGEMLDSISEYSVQFGKMGLSADEMFNMLQAGADSGAWSLDKIGDAVKESAIRTIDLSDSSSAAFKSIGLDAGAMGKKFGAGGDSANKAFKETIMGISAIKDPLKQNEVGVQLFGTMWEDLSPKVVAAMGDISNKTYDTKNALDGMNNTKYNDLGSAMEGIKRVIEVAILPAAAKVANKLNEFKPQIEEVANFVANNLGTIVPVLGGIGAAVGAIKVLSAINQIKTLTSGLGFLSRAKAKDKGVTSALNAINAKDASIKGRSLIATKLQTAATTIWSGVSKAAALVTKGLGLAFRFMTGPIGLVIAAIALVVAGGVALYKNWDTVKAYAVSFAGKIKDVFIGIKNKIVGAFTVVRDKISSVFGALGGIIKAPINGIIKLVNSVIDKVNSVSIDVPEVLQGVFGVSKIGFSLKHMNYLATGGITDGVTIAGEGGYDEFVITPDPKYRSNNLSLWAQAGRALGASPEDYRLPDNNGGGDIFNAGGIAFSPVIYAGNDANTSDIMSELEAAEVDFFDMLEVWYRKRREWNYG